MQKLYAVGRAVVALAITVTVLLVGIGKFVVSDERGPGVFLKSEQGKHLTNVGRGAAEAVQSAYDPSQHNFTFFRFCTHLAYGLVGLAIIAPVVYLFEKHVYPRIIDWDAKRCLQAGDNRMRLGSYKRAIKSYSSAIQNRPDLVLAYLGRGQANSALGNNDAALRDFTKVKELDPSLLGDDTRRSGETDVGASIDATGVDL